MRSRIAVGASLTVALLVGGVMAAESLKSGPQVGKSCGMPFEPLNVTGKFAGNKRCLVWANGGKPVAMIFAREISGPLTSLVKKIDEANDKQGDKKMGSFVVFLSDDEGLEKKLKDLAEKEKIEHVALAIDNPSGPAPYTKKNGCEIPKDAEITVVLYVNKTVKVNRVYKKGDFKAADVDKVVADLSKILKKDKEGK